MAGMITVLIVRCIAKCLQKCQKAKYYTFTDDFHDVGTFTGYFGLFLQKFLIFLQTFKDASDDNQFSHYFLIKSVLLCDSNAMDGEILIDLYHKPLENKFACCKNESLKTQIYF